MAAALTGLQELGLDGTRVGTAALAALVGLAHLQKLSLHWCGAITDAGARLREGARFEGSVGCGCCAGFDLCERNRKALQK